MSSQAQEAYADAGADGILYGLERMATRSSDNRSHAYPSAEMKAAIIKAFQTVEAGGGRYTGYTEMTLPQLDLCLRHAPAKEKEPSADEGTTDYQLLTQACKELRNDGFLQLKLGRQSWTYALTEAGRQKDMR